jgi:adenylate kinase family enzyme
VPTSKLIVLRGNSGAGKGTIARELRKQSTRKIAIVEQDYLRRFVLKEKDRVGADNADLIEEVVRFALGREYDVVLEGILAYARYGAMLERLKAASREPYFFYLDVSFDESVRRHATKPNAHEFGAKEMREWYLPSDLTGFAGEVVIPETSSIAETTARIVERCGL